MEVAPAMTEVAFHFNAPDKLAYACRFARKMVRLDKRLVITGAPDALATLDNMLWHMAPQDFVAHCAEQDAPELLEASPVLLLTDPRHAIHHGVLLNLGDAVPQGYTLFERLVEVVAAHDDTDRQCARTRWRQYAQSGHSIVRHDLVLKES